MLPSSLTILSFFSQPGNFNWLESELSLLLLYKPIKLIFYVRNNLLFPSITIFQVLKQPLSRFETYHIIQEIQKNTFFSNIKKRPGSYPTFHVKKDRSFAANSAVVLQDLKVLTSYSDP